MKGAFPFPDNAPSQKLKLQVLIYISTLEILPSSEGFLFNYTYL